MVANKCAMVKQVHRMTKEGGPWSPSRAEAETEPVTHRCGHPECVSLNSVLRLHRGQALWRKEHQVNMSNQKTLVL